jgi:hypothetical protein
MKKELHLLLWLFMITCMAVTCKKQTSAKPAGNTDSSLVNTRHLDYLYTNFIMPTGTNVAGIYIYSEAPDYHLVSASGEGFTCVDDVARALQVYVRKNDFATDTAIQHKALHLARFLLEMQSPNGYFYNFVATDLTINKSGSTSINTPQWWSWRALYALAEARSVLNSFDPSFGSDIDQSISRLVNSLKSDLVNIPQNPTIINGIIVPTWLPAGSGSDQAAILMLGLMAYPESNNDPVMRTYIRKLADGTAMMQLGDASHFPYSCILSWQNTWHAYGGDQAYALMKAGTFLHDTTLIAKGRAVVDNFYPFLLQNGMKSSFEVESTGSDINLIGEKSYEQIAYGIRPMVTAAAEEYRLTGLDRYADMAGHLAAWFLGANDVRQAMYSMVTGRCFDGIQSSSAINKNAGAESTIEALFTMEIVEQYPAVKAALNRYKK